MGGGSSKASDALEDRENFAAVGIVEASREQGEVLGTSDAGELRAQCVKIVDTCFAMYDDDGNNELDAEEFASKFIYVSCLIKVSDH